MAENVGADDDDAGDVFVYTGQPVVPLNVAHVRIDPSITKIPEDAFQWCDELVSVQMHDAVEEIMGWAFYGCSSLRLISLKGVERVGEAAFKACSSLSCLEFSDNLDRIGNSAFECCVSLKQIILRNVTVIGRRAFGDCRDVTTVECGEKLIIIEEGAFNRCHSLKRVVIPLRNTMIGFYDGAFNCDELSTIELVDSIHKTISSFHLDCWKNEMTQLINRVQLSLRTTPTSSKTTCIQNWMVSVHRSFNKYKRQHEKMIKDASTLLELALWKFMLEETNEVSISEVKPNKRAKVDVNNTRMQVRVTSGAVMSIVIKNVFPYLRLKE